MDGITVIRLAAGLLALVLLCDIIARRRQITKR